MIIGLLLPLIVKLGSLDLYDHFKSPVFLSRAISSPEDVLTIINLASIATFDNTSAFTLEDQISFPLDCSKIMTFPSISDTAKTPKPDDMPAERLLVLIVQFSSPV